MLDKQSWEKAQKEAQKEGEKDQEEGGWSGNEASFPFELRMPVTPLYIPVPII